MRNPSRFWARRRHRVAAAILGGCLAIAWLAAEVIADAESDAPAAVDIAPHRSPDVFALAVS